MNISGWIQLAFYVLVLLAITKPLGLYLVQVLDANGKTFLDPIVRPIERLTYRILGVKPDREQNWIQYAVALLIFSVVSMIFTYGILRLQDHLPLNPQKFPAVADHLSFNTAASFTTNTNWQSYSGESTMSQFSQMVAFRGGRDCSGGSDRARDLSPFIKDVGKFLGRCHSPHLLSAAADLRGVRPVPGSSRGSAKLPA